jgi:hypothetical protein
MEASGEFDWGSLWSGVMKVAPAVAAAYGANQVSKANTGAANIAGATSAANIAEIRAANERAAATLSPIAARATPALDYMSTVMAADPNKLTPAQQIELGDRRRQVVGNITPGLRGSGRFVTGAVNDVVNRGRAGMIADNTRRADEASRSLGSAGVNATTNQASIATGQGPQVAQQNTLAGDARANAMTGTAESNATTLGNIASFFANQQKDAERDSRYKTFKGGVGA